MEAIAQENKKARPLVELCARNIDARKCPWLACVLLLTPLKKTLLKLLLCASHACTLRARV